MTFPSEGHSDEMDEALPTSETEIQIPTQSQTHRERHTHSATLKHTDIHTNPHTQTQTQSQICTHSVEIFGHILSATYTKYQ